MSVPPEKYDALSPDPSRHHRSSVRVNGPLDRRHEAVSGLACDPGEHVSALHFLAVEDRISDHERAGAATDQDTRKTHERGAKVGRVRLDAITTPLRVQVRSDFRLAHHAGIVAEPE